MELHPLDCVKQATPTIDETGVIQSNEDIGITLSFDETYYLTLLWGRQRSNLNH